MLNRHAKAVLAILALLPGVAQSDDCADTIAAAVAEGATPRQVISNQPASGHWFNFPLCGQSAALLISCDGGILLRSLIADFPEQSDGQACFSERKEMLLKSEGTPTVAIEDPAPESNAALVEMDRLIQSETKKYYLWKLSEDRVLSVGLSLTKDGRWQLSEIRARPLPER